MIKLFGAPFDPLDISERVDIKLAYLDWLRDNHPTEDDFSDPYDFLEKGLRGCASSSDQIQWIGHFPVESWLKPKPSISDLDHISQHAYTRFLDDNGCYDYYWRLRDYLGRNVGAAIPVMIGVDHCLTGSVLSYVKERYTDYNVVIFDSHCDLIDMRTRQSYFHQLSPGLASDIGEKEIYECGSFLHHLLTAGIIRPDRLWIIGTQDLEQLKEGSHQVYSERILPWMERGIHVLSKSECLSSGIPEQINGPTYISFDMDVGSLASVLAARFLNYVGLDTAQMKALITQLSARIKSRDIELVGLDIMEMDIHFVGESIEGCDDHAGELAAEIVLSLIYDNFMNKGAAWK